MTTVSESKASCIRMKTVIAMRDGGRLFSSRSHDEETGKYHLRIFVQRPDGTEFDIPVPDLDMLKNWGLIAGADPVDIHYYQPEFILTDVCRERLSWLDSTTTWWHFANAKTPKMVAESERRRISREAKKLIKALTFYQGARLRGGKVMWQRGDRVESNGPWTTFGTHFEEAVLVLVRPHVEAFVDVDGVESHRMSDAGIIATAVKRRAPKEGA